jgi:hypothetical protein
MLYITVLLSTLQALANRSDINLTTHILILLLRGEDYLRDTPPIHCNLLLSSTSTAAMSPIFKNVTFLSRKSIFPNMNACSLLTYVVSLYVAAQGTQFITGACKSDAECASACCGFTSAKCAAPFVANERGEGCGFGEAQSNNNALTAGKGKAKEPAVPTASAPPAAAAGNATVKAAGTQFITGSCTADDDCAAGCCGFKSGKCEGAVVSQERDGCGFGQAQPNNNAAKALQGKRIGRRGAA